MLRRNMAISTSTSRTSVLQIHQKATTGFIQLWNLYQTSSHLSRIWLWHLIFHTWKITAIQKLLNSKSLAFILLKFIQTYLLEFVLDVNSQEFITLYNSFLCKLYIYTGPRPVRYHFAISSSHLHSCGEWFPKKECKACQQWRIHKEGKQIIYFITICIKLLYEHCDIMWCHCL